MIRTRKAMAWAALACGCLAATLPGIGPGPTLADAYGEPITTQPYYEALRMGELGPIGYTGEGVTIAILDSPIDTGAPELQGVDIQVMPTGCVGDEHANRDRSHGTAVASVIASPAYGWAPKAKILSYPLAQMDLTNPAESLTEYSKECGKEDPEEYITRAALDGADIINISMSMGITPGVNQSVLEAIDLGAAVVVGTGNDGEKDAPLDGSQLNGTIGVGSSNVNGDRSGFSNWGKGLTVVAPGEDITIRDPDDSGALTQIRVAQGTSFAAPQVSGLLALGKQNQPEATMNQVTRALIDTASRAPGTGWNEDFGWGSIENVGFLNTDPLAYEDSNPLLDKDPALPGAQWLQDVRDGLVYPDLLDSPDYVYRGAEDIEFLYPGQVERCTSPRYERDGMPAECEQYLAAKAKAPKPGAADADADNATTGAAGDSDSSGSSPLPWIIGGAAVLLLGGGGAAAFAVTRRKKAPAAAGDVSLNAVQPQPQQQPLPTALQPPATPPTEPTQWRPED